MSFVDTDKWTCPTCSRTVVVNGTERDTTAALQAVQARHAKAHRDAAATANRVYQADRREPTRRHGAA